MQTGFNVLRLGGLKALVVVLCFLPQPSIAHSLPEALLYQGKAIEPYCLKGNEVNYPEAFDIEKCEQSGWREKIGIKHPEKLKDNEFGYSYREKGSATSSYISYRYIGHMDNAEILLIQSSGGGTGFFSDIYWVKREANLLKVIKHVTGGDKCSGGIHDAKTDGKDIIIERNVTPAYFFRIAQITPPNGKKAYDYLSSHHNACFGTIREINGKFSAYLPEQSKHGFFGDLNIKNGPQTEQCFFRLFREASARDEWSYEQLKAFMLQFNQTCIEAKS